MIYNLICPHCNYIKEWFREDNPQGPGKCSCGSFQDWTVIPDKEISRRKHQKGFVKVLIDNVWKDVSPSTSVKIRKALKNGI